MTRDAALFDLDGTDVAALLRESGIEVTAVPGHLVRTPKGACATAVTGVADLLDRPGCRARV